MIEIDRYLYCEEEEERKKISHRISQSLAGYRVIKKKKKFMLNKGIVGSNYGCSLQSGDDDWESVGFISIPRKNQRESERENMRS